MKFISKGAAILIFLGVIGLLCQWDIDSNRSTGRNTGQKSRSPEWSEVREKHLEKEPVCAVCGSKKSLQVHHVLPFHKYPQLELDKGNLMTLCGPQSHNHHFQIGHAGNYQGWNPHAREDARLLKSRWDESRILAKEE